MKSGKEAKARRTLSMSDPMHTPVIPSLDLGISPYFPESVASANECTGMVPTVPEDEMDAASYRDIAPIPVTAAEETNRGKTPRKASPRSDRK